MVKAGVKKGSLIYIVGNLDITEYTRADQSKDHSPKVTLYDWCYAPTSKAKPADNNNESESQEMCIRDSTRIMQLSKPIEYKG